MMDGVHFNCEAFRPAGTHANHPPTRCFALRVLGDAMWNPRGEPSYPHGTIVIINPDRPVQIGSGIVTRCNDEAPTFKIYCEENGRRFLKALNPLYADVEMTKEHRICGTVLGRWVDD